MLMRLLKLVIRVVLCVKWFVLFFWVVLKDELMVNILVVVIVFFSGVDL